jgi:hypothetical protein
MENITIPQCKIDTAKDKQPEHSAKKEWRRIDVLFSNLSMITPNPYPKRIENRAMNLF